MWVLKMKDEKYNEMAFRFDTLKEALTFTENAIIHSQLALEFSITYEEEK